MPSYKSKFYFVGCVDFLVVEVNLFLLGGGGGGAVGRGGGGRGGGRGGGTVLGVGISSTFRKRIS